MSAGAFYFKTLKEGAVSRLQGAFHLALLITFNHVTHLNIIEAIYTDPAVKPALHFTRIVLMTFQGTKLPCINNNTIANQSDRVVSFDGSICHHTTSNGSNFRDLKDFADFCIADHHLLRFRGKHPFHSRPNP